MTSTSLTRYAARRLGISVVVLVMMSFVVFAGVDILPGDPVTSRMGTTLSPEEIADVQLRLGLDRPLLDRYLDWALRFLHGDLGTSIVSGEPVGSLLDARLGNSLLLALLVVLVALPLSVVFGVWTGVRRGSRLDRAVSAVSILMVGLPEYVLASVLVLVFSFTLGWLPAVSLIPAEDNPLQHPELLLLPVASLVLLSLAYSVRVIRATTAAAFREPHVENARLNGASEPALLRQAVLPAVVPVVAQIWCVLGVGLIGGAILVEQVFGYPGVGGLLVASVQSGDLPVAQAAAVILGGAMLLALLAADLIVVWFTPRLRTEAR